MIQIYSSSWCSYCTAAKKLLNQLELDFEEINIEEKNISREELLKLCGSYTVPQICINGEFIGGYDELQKLYQNNKLMDLLKNE